MILNIITLVISLWDIHHDDHELLEGYDEALYYQNSDGWIQYDTLTDFIAEHDGSFARDQ